MREGKPLDAGLERKRTSDQVFRIARKPDPWLLLDWAYALPDGTFGNRFDDPLNIFRVLYASSQRVSCFIETLARFRPSLELLQELKQIKGDDDFFPIGSVPEEWCSERLMGTAQIPAECADIYAAKWIAYLRRKLFDDCLLLGLKELDASVLQSAAPRRITQLASRKVFEAAFPGIYYRSRHGHNFENWAFFEPVSIRSSRFDSVSSDDQDLAEALNILGLRIGS